jgi:hypothetical protein
MFARLCRSEEREHSSKVRARGALRFVQDPRSWLKRERCAISLNTAASIRLRKP